MEKEKEIMVEEKTNRNQLISVNINLISRWRSTISTGEGRIVVIRELSGKRKMNQEWMLEFALKSLKLKDAMQNLGSWSSELILMIWIYYQKLGYSARSWDEVQKQGNLWAVVGIPEAERLFSRACSSMNQKCILPRRWVLKVWKVGIIFTDTRPQKNIPDLFNSIMKLVPAHQR